MKGRITWPMLIGMLLVLTVTAARGQVGGWEEAWGRGLAEALDCPDLAANVYGAMAASDEPERAAKGELGLAHLDLRRRETTDSPERSEALIDSALARFSQVSLLLFEDPARKASIELAEARVSVQAAQRRLGADRDSKPAPKLDARGLARIRKYLDRAETIYVDHSDSGSEKGASVSARDEAIRHSALIGRAIVALLRSRVFALGGKGVAAPELLRANLKDAMQRLGELSFAHENRLVGMEALYWHARVRSRLKALGDESISDASIDQVYETISARYFEARRAGREGSVAWSALAQRAVRMRLAQLESMGRGAEIADLARRFRADLEAVGDRLDANGCEVSFMLESRLRSTDDFGEGFSILCEMEAVGGSAAVRAREVAASRSALAGDLAAVQTGLASMALRGFSGGPSEIGYDRWLALARQLAARPGLTPDVVAGAKLVAGVSLMRFGRNDEARGVLGEYYRSGNRVQDRGEARINERIAMAWLMSAWDVVRMSPGSEDALTRWRQAREWIAEHPPAIPDRLVPSHPLSSRLQLDLAREALLADDVEEATRLLDSMTDTCPELSATIAALRQRLAQARGK